ncbi:hypothetical protein [Nakamurella aerolata]|nr:hypothetical protein [Nakamurella aerolata]
MIPADSRPPIDTTRVIDGRKYNEAASGAIDNHRRQRDMWSSGGS